MDSYSSALCFFRILLWKYEYKTELSRTEQLQQELNFIEYQNEQLEDRVDTLSDIIDLIIIYITSDDLPEVENPSTSAQII